jgi:hypothetical protein
VCLLHLVFIISEGGETNLTTLTDGNGSYSRILFPLISSPCFWVCMAACDQSVIDNSGAILVECINVLKNKSTHRGVGVAGIGVLCALLIFSSYFVFFLVLFLRIVSKLLFVSLFNITRRRNCSSRQTSETDPDERCQHCAIPKQSPTRRGPTGSGCADKEGDSEGGRKIRSVRRQRRGAAQSEEGPSGDEGYGCRGV